MQSGSIIAAGYYKDNNSNVKDYGILVKIDKNGCMDTLFCTPITSVKSAIKESDDLIIFPNPASEVLNIYFKNNLKRKDGLFRLIDINGRTVLELKAERNDLEYKIPVGKYASGIYFLQYMQEGILMKSEKVVIAK